MKNLKHRETLVGLLLILCLFRVFVTEGQEPILATLKWSPDGQMIAGVRTDWKLMVWSTNGSILLEKPFEQISPIFGWSADSTRIAVGDYNSDEILIVNIGLPNQAIGSIITRIPNPGGGYIFWTSDGNYILSFYPRPEIPSTLRIWQVDNLTNTLTSIYDGPGPEYNLKLSPSGQKIALLSSGGVGWQNILGTTGDFVSFGSPADVAWSPDSRYLALLAMDPNRLKVYDTSIPVPAVNNDGNLAWQLSGNVALPSYDFEWSPDGTRMASVVEINGITIVQVFNATTGAILQEYSVNLSRIHSDIAWSPDGSHLAYVNIVNGVSSFVIVTPPTVSSPTATFTPTPTPTPTP